MNLMEDLTTRMAPSAADIEAAGAALREAGTEMAVTPIMFPGKEYGLWATDTEVVTLDGAVVIPANNDDSYRHARNDAAVAAAKAMGERPGTVGYVVHRAGGDWAVFEEILSPARLLSFES